MNKLIYTLFMCCVLSSVVYGQTGQGAKLIGGDFAFNSNLGDDKAMQILIRPTVGYFIADGFAVGGLLEYEQNRQSDVFSTSKLGLAPFARYYIDFAGGGTKLLLQASLGFENIVAKTGGTKNSENGLFTGLGAGVAIFVQDNVALEALLEYRAVDVFTDEADNNLGIRLGFQVYFD